MENGVFEWDSSEIEELSESGIIKGTGENTYSPERSIKRADFAILLVRAFSLSRESEDNFRDVPEEAYYAKELSAAKANGLARKKSHLLSGS